MFQRILLYDPEAKTQLKKGIDALTDMVKVTLGPKGNNVIIERPAGPPLITKDGVTVAKEIFLEDDIANIGAQLLKVVALKTNETAGDGTTTATVLAQALISEGIKNVTAGANPIDLKRGMDLAVKKISEELKSKSKKVTGKEDIINVASISANNDYEIGNYIADAIEKAGEEGTVIVEDSKSSDTIIDLVEGLQIDRGYTSPHFINRLETMSVELNNTYILFYNGTLSQIHEVGSIADKIIKKDSGASFLIIADDFDPLMQEMLLLNKIKGGRQFCAVKSPGFGDRQVDLLGDIAISTGGTVLGGTQPINLSSATLNVLGFARKVVITSNKTIIVEGKGNPDDILQRVEQIKFLIKETSTDFDRQKLQERLGTLTGGVVTLRVGAVTETELKEKKMRIEDALHATRAALEEGILPGGGIALVRAREVLKDTDNFEYLKGSIDDQKTGIKIVYKALEVPFLSICENAGLEGKVILKELEKREYKQGYDVLNDTYGDMFELGVIDPTKVVRLTLENANSVAGMFLTTKGIIAQSKEEKGYIDKLMTSSPQN